MGDREILETYLNSASKNTSETDIFPHGPKPLLTSVIIIIIIIITTTTTTITITIAKNLLFTLRHCLF